MAAPYRNEMVSKHPAAVRWREAGVNLAILSVCVAAGEIGLRIADVQVSLPSPRLAAVPRDPAFPEHDSRGFRNREVLERADVVLMGDSMTYGSGEIAMSTLLAMAQDAGAAFAVVLLPTKESVFAPRVANLGDHEDLAELVAAEARARDELAAMLRANDIAVLDLLPPLRDAPEQPYPVGTGRHPNPSGNRVIGSEAAEFVRGMRRRPARRVERVPAAARGSGNR